MITAELRQLRRHFDLALPASFFLEAGIGFPSPGAGWGLYAHNGNSGFWYFGENRYIGLDEFEVTADVVVTIANDKQFPWRAAATTF